MIYNIDLDDHNDNVKLHFKNMKSSIVIGIDNKDHNKSLTCL